MRLLGLQTHGQGGGLVVGTMPGHRHFKVLMEINQYILLLQQSYMQAPGMSLCLKQQFKGLISLMSAGLNPSQPKLTELAEL